ncbi:MAG: ABC transporter, partial [Gammaproteobacteria bacterium]|nr:ABC transporter [Gammaproteobacteria bacterium]
VEYDSTKVLTDSEQALMVNVGDAPRPIQHFGMMGVPRESFVNDIVNTGLQVMNFSTPGALVPIEGATTVFEPLLLSSNSSMLMDNFFFTEMADPTILVDEFVSEDRRYAVAARVQGNVRSAFPNGRPTLEVPGVEGLDTDDPAAEPTVAADSALQPHLNESTGTVNLILVADSDFLADRMWVQIQTFLGQRIGSPFASNGAFVMNALDNLSGNAELVTIRSRGRYARPFETVLDLQRAADARLREEERELLENLRQTELQIASLNASRQGNEITPELQAEVDRFYAQQLETRRRLREVQLQLNQDIENLGSVLKFINTALVPILLIVFALTLAYLRNRRRDITGFPAPGSQGKVTA